MRFDRSDLRWLQRATEAEGRRLAKLVKRGKMTRDQLEQVAEAHPGDDEPRIALALLDRWGIS